MDWPAIAAVAGIVAAMTAVFVFLWRINNSFRDKTESLRDDFATKTDSLRNDLAWVNEDLGKMQKDVEWLVWFFKKDQQQ